MRRRVQEQHLPHHHLGDRRQRRQPHGVELLGRRRAIGREAMQHGHDVGVARHDPGVQERIPVHRVFGPQPAIERIRDRPAPPDRAGGRGSVGLGNRHAHGASCGRSARSTSRARAASRRRLEYAAKRHLHAERVTQANDQLGAEKRVAAEHEEVVADADGVHAEQVAHQLGEPDLVSDRGAMNPGSRSASTVSTAGNRARSTLPLGVSGRRIEGHERSRQHVSGQAGSERRPERRGRPGQHRRRRRRRPRGSACSVRARLGRHRRLPTSGCAASVATISSSSTR